MYLLSGEITRELASEYLEMIKEGESMEIARDHIKSTVVNNYDGEVWAVVDSEENDQELDYYEMADEVTDEIIILAETYLENEENF